MFLVQKKTITIQYLQFFIFLKGVWRGPLTWLRLKSPSQRFPVKAAAAHRQKKIKATKPTRQKRIRIYGKNNWGSYCKWDQKDDINMPVVLCLWSAGHVVAKGGFAIQYAGLKALVGIDRWKRQMGLKPNFVNAHETLQCTHCVLVVITMFQFDRQTLKVWIAFRSQRKLLCVRWDKEMSNWSIFNQELQNIWNCFSLAQNYI